jgi:hypothetical protein
MSEEVLLAPTKTSVSQFLKSLVPTYIHFWRGRIILIFHQLVFEYFVEDVYCSHRII